VRLGVCVKGEVVGMGSSFGVESKGSYDKRRLDGAEN
jgi:hypothetical protein